MTTTPINSALIPDESQIFSWIEEVFRQGVRRPGYPADRWAESWAQDQFRSLGLTHVRGEPVAMTRWEPNTATLIVRREGTGTDISIPCFPLPHAAPVDDLALELVAYDPATPERVEGAISLYDAPRLRVPHSWYAGVATWYYDPDNTFERSHQVLPFGRELMEVMEPSIAAGAAAFVGTLSGYPGDSHEYYVPYDAKERPIPGVWISDSHGQRLRTLLSEGRVTARLSVDAVSEPITSFNIVGELPGPGDDTVIIGSHHDGPWSSAVEDASGIAPRPRSGGVLVTYHRKRSSAPPALPAQLRSSGRGRGPAVVRRITQRGARPRRPGAAPGASRE